MDSLSFIANIQTFFAQIDAFLRWISPHLYSKHYLLLAAIIYWSGYHKLAMRLACAILISTLLFIFIKPFINAPRPYWLDTNLFQGIKESGYGMPSGHSQNAVVFWGLAAWSVRHRLFTALALLMIFSVALSRIYLGVHFPSQVLAGIGLGLFIMLLWVALEHKIQQRLALCSCSVKLSLALTLPFAPLVIIYLSSLLFQLEQGSQAQYNQLILVAGMLAGLFTSLTISQHKEASQPGLLLFLNRAIPGAMLIIALWHMTATPPALIKSQLLIYSYCLIRGFLLSIWAMILWPWLHGQLRSLLRKS